MQNQVLDDKQATKKSVLADRHKSIQYNSIFSKPKNSLTKIPFNGDLSQLIETNDD